jgi:hypothetical protein
VSKCNNLCLSMNLYIGFQRPRGSSRGRTVAIRALTLGAFSALWVAGVTQARAAVQAPGFVGGPRVVSGGLLWAGISSGQENVFLSTSTSTRLLVPDADLSAVRVDDGWAVVDEASGPKVGKIGQRLRAVQRLRRCPPIRSNRVEGDRLEAVANDNLYAVVRASCFGRRPGDAQLLVRVHLGTDNLHVIGTVPSGAISLAAAGSRLAMTYEIGAGPIHETSQPAQDGSVRVEVVESRNAHVLYRLAPPQTEPGRYRETQLDAKGDVLVTSVRHVPPPDGGKPFGWWGNPRTRVGRPLKSEYRFGASLSEGHIAYVTSGEGRTESLDVLNLATGKTRTIVTLIGSASLQGFGLGKTILAWAQQNYGYKLYNARQDPGPSCVGTALVGSAELTERPLSAAGPPIIVNASLGPSPAGPDCPTPPRADFSEPLPGNPLAPRHVLPPRPRLLRLP